MTDLLDPVWAESGDRGAQAPSDEKIETGFVSGDKPTLQMLNWMQNRAENQTNAQNEASKNVAWSNIKQLNTLGGSAKSMIFHPVFNQWLLCDASDIYYLRYGTTWTLLFVTGGLPYGHNVAITPTYAVFPIVGGDLFYITLTTSATDATIAMADIRSVCSKYVKGGSDEFLMVGGASGAIEYSLTGVGGTWLTATIAGAGNVDYIEWMGGEKFAAISGTKLYITTNNGSSWADNGAVGDLTAALGVAYNSDTDRLVVVGNIVSGTASAKAFYSDDDGTIWTEVNLYNDTTGASTNLLAVEYISGLVWIAVGNLLAGPAETTGAGVQVPIVVSYDDGVTFEAPYPDFDVKNLGGATVAFDGRRYMVAADDGTGIVITSLAASR